MSADSAKCPACQSTKIMFDIEFTDEILSEIAKMTGRSVPETRKRLAEISEAIAERRSEEAA